jgi:hypothetical protein
MTSGQGQRDTRDHGGPLPFTAVHSHHPTGEDKKSAWKTCWERSFKYSDIYSFIERFFKHENSVYFQYLEVLIVISISGRFE